MGISKNIEMLRKRKNGLTSAALAPIISPHPQGEMAELV